MDSTLEIDWYFDFVSPFAYIGLQRLAELAPLARISPRPVLFAGLLAHWGQLGPAEIPSKRRCTYRMALWQARQSDLAFQFPAAHPFNPLPYLRLAIAAGGGWDAIHKIFDELWTTGCDPASKSIYAALAGYFGITPSAAEADAIKGALRESTEAAAGHGVFGVPSLRIGSELFWGADAIDFASAYLADPGLFEQPQMKHVDTLPVGAARRR